MRRPDWLSPDTTGHLTPLLTLKEVHIYNATALCLEQLYESVCSGSTNKVVCEQSVCLKKKNQARPVSWNHVKCAWSASAMLSTGTQMHSSIELFKCRVIDHQLYSVLTGENTDALQLSLSLTVHGVSVRVFDCFQGPMTLNAEAGWRMCTSRKHWREWNSMTEVVWLTSDANPAAREKKTKPSACECSFWTNTARKPNRILSYEGWFTFQKTPKHSCHWRPTKHLTWTSEMFQQALSQVETVQLRIVLGALLMLSC